MHLRSHHLGLILGTLLGVSLTACVKSERTEPEPSPSASASAAEPSPVEAFFQDDRAALTEGVYEQLIVALSTCKVTESGVEPRCPALEQLRRARSRNTVLKDLAGMNARLGKKYLTHESAAVRYQAASMMQSIFGSDEASQKLILERARSEQEPAVILALVRVVGSRVKSDVEVKQLLLEMGDHAAESVRREALGWLVTSFAEGVTEGFDKVAAKLEQDPSEAVRAYLCDRLYGSSEPRALPLLKRLLTDPKTPKKVYDGCWSGLIKTWTGFPQPKHPLKEGYELTVKLLEATPRDSEHPPWSGLSLLRAAKTEFQPTDRFGTDWYAAVKPWYKKERLLKALEAVATDSKAHWMARTSALSVMQELGTPKATFEKLHKRYEGATAGDDFQVKRRLGDVLARLGARSGPSSAGSAPPPGTPKPPPRPAAP